MSNLSILRIHFLTFMLLLSSKAFSQTTYYVKTDGNDGSPGTSWDQSFASVQKAIESARAGDTVFVKKGSYPLTATITMKDGVKIYGSFAGWEASLSERNVTLPVADDPAVATILNGRNTVRVITNNNITNAMTASAVLDGFVIKEGNVNGNGGGMYNNNASPTLRNLLISDNRASYGGGITNDNGSKPSLTNVIISGNIAFGEGGSIGGGMLNGYSSSPTLTNVIISGNTADAGGGLLNYNSSATLTNVTISGNKASNAGGGILNTSSSLIMRNSIIWGNTADRVNGISNDSDSTPDIQYSLVEDMDADATNNNLDGRRFTAAQVFVNPQSANSAPTTTGDYRLLSCSPAVNAGTTPSPPLPTDIIGNNRVGAYDLGAYEFQSPGIYYVKTDGNDANSGTSWDQSFATVQKAISVACTGDTVFVKKGNYPLAAAITMKNGVGIYGGFAGGEASLSERAMTLPVADDPAVATVLNGQNAVRVINNDTLVTTSYLTASAVLDGFVIKEGNVNGSGGGMYNNNASPTLRNLLISGNTASAGGGGMGNYNNSSPILTNVTISGNKASGGGGMSNANNSNPILTDVTISGNAIVSGLLGGGMYNNNSSPTLSNVIISDNRGSYGGGITNDNGSKPSLTNVTISGNIAVGGGGSIGGGMLNGYSSSPTLTNVIISGNTADAGGGMLNYYSGATLTNVTISGNNASSGGGMYNSGSSSATLTNVTISGNTAGNDGGGIANAGSLIMRNSIILGNTGNNINGIYNYDSTPDIKYSLVEGMAADAAKNNLEGINITAAHVFVNPVATSSAPTTIGDYRLSLCSPAINAGTTPSPAVAKDIVGNNRVGAYDLGAYEFQGLGINGSMGIAIHQRGSTVIYSTCAAAIATVTSAATGGAGDSTTVTVWIETTQPAQYVKRHYEIAPVTDGAGRVTLYFTQAEFNDFNAVNTTDLPTGPGDATGKANLKIEKRNGQSSDGTGLPATYAGAVSTIDPADEDIVWNSSLSRWEVSFDVTSFSGFFARSTNNPLPVTLATFEARRDENTVSLSWKTTSELNSDYFDVERSTDRKNWEAIGKIAAVNNSQSMQPYAFRDVTPRSGENLYRLKMVDLDGSFAYSRLRSVIFEVPDEVVLYPNPPAGAQVQVRVNPRYVGSQATLIDASGKALRTFIIPSENFPLSLDNTAMNLLRMYDGKTVKVLR